MNKISTITKRDIFELFNCGIEQNVFSMLRHFSIPIMEG